MSKAYSIGITTVTMTNASTTTMPAYTFVKLSTTEEWCDTIATKGQKPYGVTQETINPSEEGKIALCSAGGISRLKMASTAYTTIDMATTAIYIGSAANSKGIVLTSTSSCVGAISNGHTFAASDIISVQLIAPRRVIEA
jgi:hypothetical protein